MKNSIRNIGAGLALTGAVLTGAGCSNGTETPKKEAKPALTTDQELAIQAIKSTEDYLENFAGGSNVGAMLDTDEGPEFHGGTLGNQDLCFSSWSNKVESIKTGAKSEGRIGVSYDKQGNESVYVMVVKEEEDGTFTDGTVSIKASNQKCDLQSTPEEVVAEAIRLAKLPDSDISFQTGMETTNVPTEAVEALEKATQ